MVNLNLQYPIVLIRTIQNYANYPIPPLDNTHFYGVIEQVNNATMGYSEGDVVLFGLDNVFNPSLPLSPSFFNNEIRYFFVDEHNIFSTIDNILDKIFDFTFDFTFE